MKFKLLGYEIVIHITFWVAALFCLFPALFSLDPWYLLQSVSIFCLAFSLVLGHELSHATMAKYFGYQTKRVYLHFFGGVALIEGFERSSTKEDLLITFAGPAFNLVMAGLGFLGLIGLAPLEAYTWGHTVIRCVFTFMAMNLWIGLFNLIPAYPLDGGRIALALATKFLGTRRGSEVASAITKLAAIFMIIIGIFTHLYMLAVLGAIILYFGRIG